MAHKFNIKHMKKLDSPERRKNLPPEDILKMLELKHDDIVADIGCGIGYFTIPAAKIIGENGKVYALDISTEMLDEVNIRADQEELNNIECINVDEYDLMLKDNSVNFAFISNVLHEVEDLNRYIKEIRRIINNNGKLSIIEWDKKITNFGPPIEERLDRDYLEKALKDVGFIDIQSKSYGQEFYIIIACNV